MPIKWSALQVSEAMEMVEEYVNQATLPLEQAKLVADEARKIPNLPTYVGQHLTRLIGEIERIIGGVHSWNQQPYEGNVKAAIKSIREAIPEGTVETERQKIENGKQLSLVN